MSSLPPPPHQQPLTTQFNFLLQIDPSTKRVLASTLRNSRPHSSLAHQLRYDAAHWPNRRRRPRPPPPPRRCARLKRPTRRPVVHSVRVRGAPAMGPNGVDFVREGRALLLSGGLCWGWGWGRGRAA
jgi:hypothetical protein